MNLNYLYYFDVLGEQQHYGKAADILHITQPGLSQTIAKLEEELAIPLFERKGRNVVLTKAGSQYWKRIHYAIKEMELAREEFTASVSEGSGKVDIGFTFVLGSSFIPHLMRSFLNIPNNENIVLTTMQGDSPEIIAAVKSRKCDVGFCAHAANEPDLKFVPIFYQKLVLIVPKEHPLSSKREVFCEDISNFPFVSFKKTHAMYDKLLQIFDSQGLAIRPTYEVTEDTAMAGLVASNLGIAIIPDSPLLDYFPVIRLPLRNAPTSRYLYMCYMENVYQTPAVQNFLSYTLKHRKLEE